MKRIFFLCAMVSAGIALAAQQGDGFPGVPVEIGVDADAWASGIIGFRDDNVTRRLPQGTRVLGEITHLRDEINGVIEDLTRIRHGGNLYNVRTRDLVPAGGGRLSTDWITAPNTQPFQIAAPDARRRWVASYFLDVLQSQDRDTFWRYEQPWMDRETAMIMGGDPMGGSWFTGLWSSSFESLFFFDAVIFIGSFSGSVFFITDIIPFNTGYRITMANQSFFTADWLYISALPFPLWSERQSFDLIFIPDGDFMDVYLDSLDSHFATFAKVDAAVLEELGELARTNTVDLSRIRAWPRRADGSMDFPPPDGVTLAFRASHRTTARLHVRESPTTAANIVTTLDLGAEVQILETGSQETIGGVTAPWVRVLAANGYTGWSFAGFLEAVQLTVPVQAELAMTVMPVVSEAPSANGPPVLWYIAGGGAVALLLVGVVVFLARRKR